MSVKILFVDDDINILEGYRRSLRKQFEIDIAQGGEEALRKLSADGPYAVVVSDMHMPRMNGVQFLAKAKEAHPETVRMMLTGNADLNTAMAALNEGNIFRFLIKPFSNDNMAVVLTAAIDQYKLITLEKDMLEKTLRGSIRMLVEILSSINPELFGRSLTMRQQMKQVATALGLRELWSLELAAMLSQIGTVTLPTSLVAKIEKHTALTISEQTMADRIPEISAGLLANIPRLETVSAIIRDHKLPFDPTDPANADIPIGCRILHVLIDLNTLEKLGMERHAALVKMRRRESIYDPAVLDAVRKCLAGSVEVKKERVVQSIPISVSQLTLGLVLTADLLTEDGVLLVAAGHQITNTLLEKIKNYAVIAGIKEPLYVEKPTLTAEAAVRRQPSS